MKTTEKKQVKRRKEIIEAIMPTLEQIPLDELSIKDICTIAGISVGTFYHYFERKEDLGIAVLMKADEYLACNVFPHMTSYNEIENLRIYGMGITRYVSDIGVERARFTMAHFKPSKTDLDGNLRCQEEKLTQTVRMGQEKGQIICDYPPEELAEFVRISVQGIGVEWTRDDGAYSLIEKMERFLDVFLRCLEKRS